MTPRGDDGAEGSDTAILIVAVADCVPLEAVTVYVVAADAAVGVPVTCPVCALKTKPAGSAGETA